MMWVVIGHTYVLSPSRIVNNPEKEILKPQMLLIV
jgi:hypothetical protein